MTLNSTFLAPNALLVRRSAAPRPWEEHVFLPGAAVPGAAVPGAAVAAGENELLLSEENGCLAVSTRNGQALFRELQPTQSGVQRRKLEVRPIVPLFELQTRIKVLSGGVRMQLEMTPGEQLYGWGEWFQAFQRSAGQVKLHTLDAIAQLQGQHTYSSIPIFYSSRGYAFWLLNSHPSTWALDPQKGQITIEAEGPGADFLLIYGPSFKRILATYTQLTGRPPLLPRWAFGLMVTGYPQEDSLTLLNRLREHRERNIPLDGIILDYQWEEGYHNFRWRRSLFPDPQHFIDELKALNLHLGLILTPFVNSGNRPLHRALLNRLAHNLPPGHEKDDERALPEYNEAREQGYLAHPKARWWFGEGGMIDFSNPQAANWWNERLSVLTRNDVDLIKNDDGEYLPPDGSSALGMDGAEYHNIYGFFYGKAIYDGLAALDGRRPFIYARSVWAGSQRYPAIFLGDQKPTFAHMQSALRAGLNMGLLGFAYWTADVFGLDGKTTPETHMRYAQWALLAPVARYFWRPPAVDATRFPWSHGRLAEESFRTHAQLRYRLLPYYCWLAWQAYQSGLPLLRPLLLEYPEDPRWAACADQALLGDRLLLAPVLEAGATRRSVQLPPGQWFDFWTDEVYPGDQCIDLPAPLERLPLLVRGGSILLMGPALPYIGANHRFETLDVHLYPPYPASAELVEEDGQTRAYQQGEYAITRFEANGDPNRLTLHLSAAEGTCPSTPALRRLTLYCHHCPRPQRVLAAPPLSPYWEYEAERCLLILHLEIPTDRESQVTLQMV